MPRTSAAALEIPGLVNGEKNRIGHANGRSQEPGDHSPYLIQRDKLDRKLAIRSLPWTDKQRAFFELAWAKSTRCLLVKGPAGTSKTLSAVYAALHLLDRQKVSDLVLVRTPVESCGAKLGYLPGTSEDKLAKYMAPFHDKLEELLCAGDRKYLADDQRVHAEHLGYLRGAHLSVKALILDEAQNCTFDELTTVATRMGEFSRLFILGDPGQSDLGRGHGRDFEAFWDLFNDADSRAHGIVTFEFTEDDVVRSAFVRFIVKRLHAHLSRRSPAGG